MNSVRKLVIIPAEDWVRMTKDSDDATMGCPREMDCGAPPPPPPPPPVEEEKEVGGKKRGAPPPPPSSPPPPQGHVGQGEGEGRREDRDTPPPQRTRNWGPPGEPLRSSRSKKWIHL